MIRKVRRRGLAAFLAFVPMVTTGEPWIAPGSAALRHDIQILADAGLLRGPVTTWPISLPDIARDVLAATRSEDHPPAVEQALVRIRRLAGQATLRGFSGIGLRAAGASQPIQLRGFADSPREGFRSRPPSRWMPTTATSYGPMGPISA
jgi:hypothetical protein